MRSNGNQDEHAALSKVVDALQDVDGSVRERILKAVATYYDVQLSQASISRSPNPAGTSSVYPRQITSREPTFSGRPDLSPKQFLEEKQPRSDVERVACLAYYLAHYRDTPHFKTVDISKLNTDAAQFKFSNAAVAVNNASLRGLLASAGKGNKQISAIGERFVAALPDRDAARKVLEHVRFRRDRGKSRLRNRETATAR